jgi:heterodisulfide reductase subunit A
VTDPKVLIVGGGIAGITAALELAGMGISSTIIERESELGGQGRFFACKASDECNRCFACVVDHRIHEVAHWPQIRVMTETTLAGLTGGTGRFEVLVRSEGREERVDVAAILVATGIDPFDARKKPELGYGLFQNVITAPDLNKILRTKGRPYRPSDGVLPSRIGFVQCVGSRDQTIGHVWCSRVCCAYALRFMRAVRYENPEIEATLFYIDIQPLGKSFASLLRFCRQDGGMRFIRSLPSRVDGDMLSGDISVRFLDPLSSEIIEEAFDLLVLSVGITPRWDVEHLGDFLHLPRNEDGFYRSPPENSGIFVSGACKGPRDIEDSIIDAKATVQHMVQYLGGI